ncbi:hypothetical protein LXA43DRAFT_1062884 [Ganoderma leucocontextum]|nr:hypothetical protein LXA43DRAFT_1062884 [Ganoderma leucocontextum]
MAMPQASMTLPSHQPSAQDVDRRQWGKEMVVKDSFIRHIPAMRKASSWNTLAICGSRSNSRKQTTNSARLPHPVISSNYPVPTLRIFRLVIWRTCHFSADMNLGLARRCSVCAEQVERLPTSQGELKGHHCGQHQGLRCRHLQEPLWLVAATTTSGWMPSTSPPMLVSSRVPLLRGQHHCSQLEHSGGWNTMEAGTRQNKMMERDWLRVRCTSPGSLSLETPAGWAFAPLFIILSTIYSVPLSWWSLGADVGTFKNLCG